MVIGHYTFFFKQKTKQKMGMKFQVDTDFILYQRFLVYQIFGHRNSSYSRVAPMCHVSLSGGGGGRRQVTVSAVGMDLSAGAARSQCRPPLHPLPSPADRARSEPPRTSTPPPLGAGAEAVGAAHGCPPPRRPLNIPSPPTSAGCRQTGGAGAGAAGPFDSNS